MKTKVVSTTFPLEIYLYGHNSFRFRKISFIFLRKHVEVKFWTCSFEIQFFKIKNATDELILLTTQRLRHTKGKENKKKINNMFSCCYTSRIVSKLVSGIPIFSAGLRVRRILSRDFELFLTIMFSTSKNIIFLWSVTIANCQQTQFWSTFLCLRSEKKCSFETSHTFNALFHLQEYSSGIDGFRIPLCISSFFF